MASSAVISYSPSFNSYSSSNLAEIAARVVEEFRAESDAFSGGHDADVFDFEQEREPIVRRESDGDKGDAEEDDEFEFAVICKDSDSSPVSADDIFYNGQICPAYPVFNTDLLGDDVELSDAKPPVRASLRDLFIEDRGRDTQSCSSSDVDDLDGISPETYCIWTPKSAEGSPERCEKSNSTGSSFKRWRFRHLVHRSKSDRKYDSPFPSPFEAKRTSANDEETGIIAGKSKPTAAAGIVGRSSATGAYKDSRRRSPPLPHKQDLVAFLENVNGLSRNLHPF